MITPTPRTSSVLRGAFVLLVVVAAVVVTRNAVCFAQRREAQSQATFKSGGERSEFVLIEISQKMDVIIQRLERIEERIAAQQLPPVPVGGKPRPPSGSINIRRPARN